MVLIFTGDFGVISSSGDMAFRFLPRLLDASVSEQFSSVGSSNGTRNFFRGSDCLADLTAGKFPSLPLSEHDGEDGVGGKSA